jgi:hypothetical protein
MRGSYRVHAGCIARRRCRVWPPAGAWLAGGLERDGDVLVDELVAAVDAVGVDGEHDVEAVPGAGGDLGRFPSGVQPQGEGGVAQVVGPPGEGSGGQDLAR